MLNEIQQRVLGVLIEKERTVPDNYPLTESALIQGCNQKSNRDPEMAVDQTDTGEALTQLREDSFVSRVEGGGRATKFKHRAEERLNVSRDELSILCELLVRGPQAPGALKPRIARLGTAKTPDQILDLLEGLARKAPTPLVERLAKRPRERDHRFGHLLGPRPAEQEGEADEVESTSPRPGQSAAATDDVGSLRDEVRTLREEVRSLRSLIDEIRNPGGGS